MVFVSIDNAREHILKLLETYKNSKINELPPIFIFHLQIGSNTTIPITSYNHEYPHFLQTLFNNPLEQFSPELISSLPNFSGENTNIHIHNIVILFDPFYKHNAELEGFKISETIGKPISVKDINHNETLIQHPNDTFTTIKVSLEIIQVACDVFEKQIKCIIDIITNFSKTTKILSLIKIIDCSSNTLLELYAKESVSNSNIHITKPDCAYKDTAISSCPIITIDSKIKDMSPCHQINSVRWLNHKDDFALITELNTVKDVCQASKKAFEFLTQMYKHTIGLDLLLCIMKLWSRLSYTNLQHIYEEGDANDANDANNSINSQSSPLLLPLLSFKFNDLTFIQFIKYWTEYPEFRKLIFDNVDSYYKHHIIIYINGFVSNYKSKIEHFTITEALQFEAFEVFRTLMKYCKEDADYIIKNIKNIEDREDYKLIERKQIIDYLKFNKIYF